MSGYSDRPFHAHRPGPDGPSGRSTGGGNSRDASAPARSATAETYYQLLGVPYGATPAEITRAYRMAMKRIHPDRAHPDRRAASEELAKDLNQAYAVLSKSASRRAYDESIRAQGIQEQIMGRYIGGFAGPGRGGAHDPFARDLRREKSPFESSEQAQANRSATVTMFAAFAGITAFIIVGMVVVAILGWIVGSIV